MSADVWLKDFSEFVNNKSKKLAQSELEKGEMEAAIMLIGSKILTLFPDDVRDNDQVPDVVIRLLEELASLRLNMKESNNESMPKL